MNNMSFNTDVKVRTGVIFYRAGFVLQSLGAVSFVLLFVLSSIYYPYAIAFFEIGILLSAYFVHSRVVWLGKALSGVFLAGVLLQVATLVGMPFGERLFFFGLSLVLVSGAIVSAIDAYRKRYVEGWLFILAYPALVLPNLSESGFEKFTIVMSTLVATLHVLNLIKMFKMKNIINILYKDDPVNDVHKDEDDLS
jgi:hypothetical protein